MFRPAKRPFPFGPAFQPQLGQRLQPGQPKLFSGLLCGPASLPLAVSLNRQAHLPPQLADTVAVYSAAMTLCQDSCDFGVAKSLRIQFFQRRRNDLVADLHPRLAKSEAVGLLIDASNRATVLGGQYANRLSAVQSPQLFVFLRRPKLSHG